MTIAHTLTIVGVLSVLPIASITAYVLNKRKEEQRVKIPVRIDENDRRR